MSLLERTGLWRLFRNDAARRVYDGLAAAGVAFGVMRWYAGPAVGSEPGRAGAEDAPDGSDSGAPDGVALRTVPADDARVPGRLTGAGDVDGGDVVVCAREDGRTVGACLLGDRPVAVPELGVTVDPPGAYLWKLAVDPAERGRGIGTALVRASRRAATDLGADGVWALVAVDNVPSQGAFESAGYADRGRAVAVSVRGRQVYRRTAPSGPLDPSK